MRRPTSRFETSLSLIESLQTNTQQLHALIERTKMGELKRMCLFLISLHDALWQLYQNGKEPIVAPPEYTVEELLSPDHLGNSAPEIVVREVRNFLVNDD